MQNDKVKSNSKYNLQQRLVWFSALIISNTSILKKSFAAQHLIKQLIRSVTSFALNYGEAQSAESKKDFIHKMKICLKELREPQVNLQILQQSNLIENKEIFQSILKERNELVAIFTSSIKTTNQTKNNNKCRTIELEVVRFTFTFLFLHFYFYIYYGSIHHRRY